MSELRYDPAQDRWIIISGDGEAEIASFKQRPTDKRKSDFCPFCEGNEGKTPPEIYAIRRPGTQPNTPGWYVRVVPNKFPALGIEGALNPMGVGMFDMMNGIGAHEVIIENPSHQRTIPDYSLEEMTRVVTAYRERCLDLRKDWRLEYILIFKNHGAAAGASLEHSHTQLIALPGTPTRVEEEMASVKRHFEYKERCLFCDMIRQEISDKKRVIVETDEFVSFAPFASRFPFESWILPKTHRAHFLDIGTREISSLPVILSRTLGCLRRLLNDPPYNYIIHTSPLRKDDADQFHWHMEIMPRLVQIAGFEWGTGLFINPVPPEKAAQLLREVS